MGEWFADWFNTPEYLNVYRHRNEKDAVELVELIVRKVNLRPGSAILDMACGAGRHSIIFARNGYNVTAFDYSELLLSEARTAAKNEGLKIEFRKADIRDFKIGSQFELVVNLFTSFGYFEDDSDNFRIAKSAYDHLQKNGHFILDFINSEHVRNHLVSRSEEIQRFGRVIQERFLENGRVKKRITVEKDGNSELYYEDVRLYSAKELENIFLEAGFRIEHILGDYKGNEFDSETSPRVIIIGSK